MSAASERKLVKDELQGAYRQLKWVRDDLLSWDSNPESCAYDADMISKAMGRLNIYLRLGLNGDDDHEHDSPESVLWILDELDKIIVDSDVTPDKCRRVIDLVRDTRNAIASEEKTVFKGHGCTNLEHDEVDCGHLPIDRQCAYCQESLNATQ